MDNKNHISDVTMAVHPNDLSLLKAWLRQVRIWFFGFVLALPAAFALAHDASDPFSSAEMLHPLSAKPTGASVGCVGAVCSCDPSVAALQGSGLERDNLVVGTNVVLALTCTVN